MDDSHAAMAEEIVRLKDELYKANVAGARVTEVYKALRGRESPGHRDATTDSYDLADWPYPPEWDAQQEYVKSLERERDEKGTRLTAALESLRCASMTNADVVELRERADKAEAAPAERESLAYGGLLAKLHKIQDVAGGPDVDVVDVLHSYSLAIHDESLRRSLAEDIADKAEASLAAFQEESETHAALNDMVRQRDDAQAFYEGMSDRCSDLQGELHKVKAERDKAVAERAAIVKVVRNCVEKLRTDPYYRQNGIIIQRILADAIEKSRPEGDRILRIVKVAEEETEAEDDKSATRDAHWAIRGDERTEADFERVKKADNRAVESREARRKAVRGEEVEHSHGHSLHSPWDANG